MRFKIDSPAIPARRFVLPSERSIAPASLPADTRPAPPLPTRPDGPYRYSARTPKRAVQAETPKRAVQAQAQRTTTPKPRTTTHQAFETFAPDMDTKPLARITLAVASEEAMPGLFGDMIFHCSPEAHNMRRLALGTMSLLRQHNDDDPVGRVLSLQHVQDRTGAWAIFGEAEIADIPRGKETLAELRTGARLGVSPAFLIREIDFDDDFNMQVKQSEIYELSLVTGPRFYGARVLNMEASMSTTNGKVHNVVSTSDLTGLSLAAAREVLRSGKGSERQRSKLEEFFTAFDAGLERGLSRDVAAAAAKLVVGL